MLQSSALIRVARIAKAARVILARQEVNVALVLAGVTESGAILPMV